eukprot:6073133-Amphidinium_carterae.2
MSASSTSDVTLSVFLSFGKVPVRCLGWRTKSLLVWSGVGLSFLSQKGGSYAQDPTCVFALGMPETTTENHKKARTEEEQDMIRAKHSETEVMSSLSIAWAGSDQLLNSDGNKHSCIVIQKGCVEHIDALSDFFSKEQYRSDWY